MPKQPSFLIIGAQKCGTTWLHRHLATHPQVFLPDSKDVLFFSFSSHKNPEALLEWYQRFDGASSEQRIGDTCGGNFWTPTGSQWSHMPDGYNRHIPQSIASLLGKDLRLIVTLRDPVERAVSAYMHHILWQSIPAGTRLQQALELVGIVDMGFYAAHIDHWCKTYDPSQLLVLTTVCDPETDTGAIWQQVCQHLDIDSGHQPAEMEQPVYNGPARSVDEQGMWVFCDPAVPQLAPEYWPWAASRQTENGSELCLISHQELETLKQIYQQDLERLAARQGAAVLSGWPSTQ